MSAAQPIPSRREHLPILLLVEDHGDTRQMYAEFLRSSFDVLEAGDGAQALAVMRERVPDVVITDLSLPVLDGFELVRRMRQDRALQRVPVICLSGYGGHAHEERAREAGCDRVLLKPCLPDTLSDAAAELVREREEQGRRS
jgi:CheY-like chemotaxis protein